MPNAAQPLMVIVQLCLAVSVCFLALGCPEREETTAGSPPAVPTSPPPEVVGQATALITIAEGGTVSITPPDPLAGTAIQIPPGALPLDMLIRLEEAPRPSLPGVVGPAIALSPAGTVLRIPATVTLVYDDATIPPGTDARTLMLAQVEPTTGSLVPLTDIVVDPIAHIVRGSTQVLAFFAVMTRLPPTPPVASAGSDHIVTVGTTVHLDGSQSSAGGGEPLTYRWAFTVLPMDSAAHLSNPTSIQPTFAVDRPGRYVIELIVSDGMLTSMPAAVTVTAVLPPPPTGMITMPTSDQHLFMGEAVLFQAICLAGAPQLPLHVTWDFGGGAPAVVGPKPGLVRFETAGTFQVTAHCTDALGGTDPNPPTRTVRVGGMAGPFVPSAMVLSPVGLCGSALAVADLNGDGSSDLVLGTTVLLGSGEETFQAYPFTATGAPARDVVVTDVNDDGIPDLVTLSYHDGAVLLGHGDGTFAAALPFYHSDICQQISFCSSAQWLRVTDLNGDGIPDLLVGHLIRTGRLDFVYFMSPLFGRGDGTFASNISSNLVWSEGSCRSYAPAVVGDLNGDGLPDLVVSDGLRVYVWLGHNDGTWQPLPQTRLEASCDSARAATALADLNGDGVPDLVLLNRVPGEIAVLFGTGQGTWHSLQPLVTGVSPTPQAVVVADLNGDDVSDLLIAVPAQRDQASTFLALLGRGDGTFPVQQMIEGTGHQMGSGFTVVDVDQNGTRDLVVCDGARVGIWLNAP